MKGDDNAWSEIKMVLHDIKWKEMIREELEFRLRPMKGNENA